MITSRKRGLHLMVFAATLFSLTMIFTVIPGQTAHALSAAYRAPCSGTGCTGQNPYTYTGSTGYPCAGVSGANWYVVATSSLIAQDGTGHQVGYVQVWYSASCNVNWGRVVPNSSYDGISNPFLWSARLYDKQTGHTYQSCDRHSNECGTWYSTNGTDQIGNMFEIDDLACFYAAVEYGEAVQATGTACQ